MIRALGFQDIDEILTIQSASYPKEAWESYEAWKVSMEYYPEGYVGWVQDNKLVGYACFFPWKDHPIFNNTEPPTFDKPDHFYIADIAILPEYRGHGIGSKFMTYVLEHTDKAGLEARGIAVQGANQLWVKFGFEIQDSIVYADLQGFNMRRKLGE